MARISIVVPCYNEAARLDEMSFVRLSRGRDIHLVFVDDGSTDGTRDHLHRIVEAHRERMDVLALDKNLGKAEAVRQGVLFAMQTGSQVVGYADADLATPVDELLRLAEIAKNRSHDAIIGSRISYLGTNIQRKPTRHYLGRVFATAASLALEAPIYDTQCGAKFFRVSPAVQRVFEVPFHSRWAFDVELLGRLLKEGCSVVEEPLQTWVDIPGSKIRLRSMVRAGLDLLRIRYELRHKG